MHTYFSRITKAIILASLLATTLLFPMTTKAKKIIRVAYPIQEGLTMKDEDGNYYGYDYDYLMQISQYTGWSYEFVEVEGTINERLTTLMNMVKEGEVDLIGGMRYNESLAELYDYPSEPYGNAYNIIAVNENSEIYDLNSLIEHKNLKIAVIDSAQARIAKLDQFASMNGFQYEKLVYPSLAEARNAVEEGKADGVLVVDLSMPENYHSVARFSPDPFYFATTKGNSEIITELNQALESIQQINPTLSSTLYSRYFSGSYNTLQLNTTQKAFIEQHPTINVLVYDGNAPIQSFAKKETVGIGRDILDHIQSSIDVKFQYIQATSFEDYKQKIASGDIDLLLGIPYEASIANTLQVTLSDPYFSSPLYLVSRQGIDPTTLSQQRQGVYQYSEQRYDNNTNYIYFETPEDILKGIEDGSADYAYINSYLYTFYANKHGFTKLTSLATPDYLRSQYAFATTKSENLSLLSIINKGIRTSQGNMQTYIYKNANAEPEYTITAFVKNNLAFISMLVLGLLIFIITSIWLYYKRQLKMKNEIELEYQRFLELSEISGEITFSFDYRQDELKISKYGIHRLANEEVICPFFHQDASSPLSSALRSIKSLIEEKEDVISEMQLRLLDNQFRWYEVILKIIRDPNKNEASEVYAVGKVLDIQDEYEERERLVQKSQTDMLTNLLNREGAQECIKAAIKAEKAVGALMMIDLDNFKEVNDTYGHLQGDHVLVDTANLLKETFPNIPIARLGGDEFILYCPQIQKEVLEELCLSLQAKLKDIPSMKDRPQCLTMSIGIVFTDVSKDYIELMRCADDALYDVKRNNRNNYKIYEDK